MKSDKTTSVREEQTSKDVLLTEDNGSAFSENIVNPSPGEEAVDENKSDNDFSAKYDRIILPEDIDVPDELNEDEGDDDVVVIKEETQSSYVNYSVLSKKELVDLADKLLHEKPVELIKEDFDNIKVQFYKKHKIEVEKFRTKFIEDGGNPEDFVPNKDEQEERLKEVFNEYKKIKSEYLKKLEIEKQENLKQKLSIIEEIKELINSTESLHDTFQQFRELQKRWRAIGPVPQSEVNNLWENYNHNVEKFYDYIKINRELRDLDLKKNLEAKIEICEKAEELILEPSVVKAFKLLQEYHEKWREIGPVPRESRAEVWKRFKEITSKINKRHQEFFENLKAAQVKNLEAKTQLCEKIEEILKNIPTTMKNWEEKSNEILEIQKVWRTIGFAPKKDNNKIYKRFRQACDEFFKQKRDFYNKIKEEQSNNLQLKLDLCVQAEALKDSTEWKKTTEDLINIQKKWKEIGPVPRKYSDQIWKRFRAACDTFFNNKAKYFESIDDKYINNLNAKLALIEEIENYQIVDDIELNFANLKDFQRRWAEIGFVPLKDKDEVQRKYKQAIDKLFENLNLDDGKRQVIKFKSKIEQIVKNKSSRNNINRERDKLIAKMKKLESDIVVWENNIGFFAKSKNAETMINEVQAKIDSAKTEIKVLEEKIKIIDSIDNG